MMIKVNLCVFLFLAPISLPVITRAEPIEELDELAGEMDSEEANKDMNLLRVSHLSEIFKWLGVRGKGENTGNADDWRQDEVNEYPGRVLVRPGAAKSIRTIVKIPESAPYRLWLGYLTAIGQKHPVTLALEGNNKARHTFGAAPLPEESAGKIEEELPLRFDGASERNTFLVDSVVVWEYWDTELTAGGTELSLSSTDRTTLLDAIFITRSKSFAPGGSRILGQDGTLNHIYYHFRVEPGNGNAVSVTLNGSVRFIVPPTLKGPYGSPLEKIKSINGEAEIPSGEWSAWLDATEATTTMGTYANAVLAINGPRNHPIEKGDLEVECAWYPHPGAVTDATKAPIEHGESRFLVPAVWGRFASPNCPESKEAEATFGVRVFLESQKLRTHREELQKQIAQIPEESLQAGVMPWRIRLMTLALVSEAEYDLAIPLLKKTGFNFVHGIKQEARQRYGLHEEDFKPDGTDLYYLFVKLSKKYGPLLDDYQPGITGDEDIAAYVREIDKRMPGYRMQRHWHPMGDEIGPAVDTASVNWVPEQRDAFHDYLREVSGNDSTFFGASTFDGLEYAGEPDKGMTRHERRLAYHSAQFKWIATARFYGEKTSIIRSIYPNALTMANYSPYTVFYYGAGMNHGQNSFALPRSNACSGHWGEDWLAPNGPSSIAGVQTESFFASVLRCGASRYHQPTGIYLIWKLGDLDRKMALLVSHGIKTINAYHWGPRYIGGGSPESSSHRVPSYAELNRAARALGPADEIIADGKLEQAQVALLYNRTDEIWNEGSPWCRTDRIYTFLALRHAHLPVDLILEEDISDEALQQFKVVYLNGANIERRTIGTLAKWVGQGGLLYAVSGTAIRDEYDDSLTEAEEFFGAAQRPAGLSPGSPEAFQPLLTEHKPIDTIRIAESPVSSAVDVPVVGVKTVLLPKSGKPIAHFADGSCAGVYRELGRGKIVLWGVMPGYLYAHNAARDDQNHPVNYTADRRSIITKAAMSTVSPSVTYSEPLVEVSRYDHDKGIAIILTDLSYRPGDPGILKVRTDRALKKVVASLAGPLIWKREGETIVIDFPVPSPIDVVVLR